LKELEEEAKEGRTKPHCSMRGKFEELQNADPYSGLVEALSDFCQKLQQGDNEQESSGNVSRIRTAVEKSLGSEKASLIAVVPGLLDVLGHDDKDDNIKETKILGRYSVVSGSSEASTGDSWNRLRYLFLKFFHAICSEELPVIMFLDDLQWADEASLGLLDALVQDPSLQNFMLVGVVRGNEVDVRLSKFLRDIEVPPRKIAHIELLNLSIDEIGEFIGDTLNLEVDDCRDLTEIVYGKTRGNIFFSIQTLEELQRRNVLFYSMISFRWEWNLAGVEFENALSSTVVEAVASKIQSLPEKLQRALVIASYTRSSIDIETLLALMIADGFDIDLRELVGLMDICVLEGLLSNTVGSNLYKFAHDRIQQAAYWLVPSGKERDDLRIMIGKNLVELAHQPGGKEWMIFVAADHVSIELRSKDGNCTY
jgi:predicted ATPase